MLRSIGTQPPISPDPKDFKILDESYFHAGLSFFPGERGLEVGFLTFLTTFFEAEGFFEALGPDLLSFRVSPSPRRGGQTLNDPKGGCEESSVIFAP